MPILALGPNGKIYQTSPDRADGLGFGCAPQVVEQQDLTLGSAYLKSQDRRRQELIRAHQNQQILDAQSARAQEVALRKQAEARRRQAAEARMYENPDLVNAVTKRAIMNGMGCSGEYSTAMSGNVLTSNGQSGWRGMSRDQKTIHHAITGAGANTAFRPDPEEMRQKQMMKHAENSLRMKARR